MTTIFHSRSKSYQFEYPGPYCVGFTEMAHEDLGNRYTAKVKDQSNIFSIAPHFSLLTPNFPLSVSPFGVVLEDRDFSSSAYRHGFNGMERDDEVKGAGNSYDFGARLYDSRLGRWLSVDPKYFSYSDLTSYGFVDNSPLQYIDPQGETIKIPIGMRIFNRKLYKATMYLIKSEEGKKALREIATARQAKRFWNDSGGAGSKSSTVKLKFSEFQTSGHTSDGLTTTKFKIGGKWIEEDELSDDQKKQITPTTSTKINIYINTVKYRQPLNDDGSPNFNVPEEKQSVDLAWNIATVAHEFWVHANPALKFILNLEVNTSPDEKLKSFENELHGGLQHSVFANDKNEGFENYITEISKQLDPIILQKVKDEIIADKASEHAYDRDMNKKLKDGSINLKKF